MVQHGDCTIFTKKFTNILKMYIITLTTYIRRRYMMKIGDTVEYKTFVLGTKKSGVIKEIINIEDWSDSEYTEYIIVDSKGKKHVVSDLQLQKLD